MNQILLGGVVILIIILFHLYKKAYATKVILFHSPKCPYCIKLMPEWNKFVSMCRFSTVVDAMEINVENNDSEIKHLKDNYQVNTWPTIIIIRGIKWDIYDGERKAQDIWNASTP